MHGDFTVIYMGKKKCREDRRETSYTAVGQIMKLGHIRRLKIVLKTIMTKPYDIRRLKIVLQTITTKLYDPAKKDITRILFYKNV